MTGIVNPAVIKGGPDGQELAIGVITNTHTCDSGTATETIAGVIPAGATVFGVTARVTTILAGAGLTTWSMGIGGDLTKWGTTLALAADTIVDPTNYVGILAETYPAGDDLVLTAAAGQFDSGVVRWAVYYYVLAAPTS